MNFCIIFKISLIICLCLTLGFADWSLQWNEEFDGKKVNESRWNVHNEEYAFYTGYLKFKHLLISEINIFLFLTRP